jgi:hypothetical protein
MALSGNHIVHVWRHLVFFGFVLAAAMLLFALFSPWSHVAFI